MTLYVGGAVLAFVHAQVLRVHVRQRQFHDGEQFGGGRVSLGPLLVGDDMFVVDGKTVIFAVRQGGIVIFQRTWAGGERHG
ncbi:hypothetical protein D3C71_1869960 [compost metagenome]